MVYFYINNIFFQVLEFDHVYFEKPCDRKKNGAKPLLAENVWNSLKQLVELNQNKNNFDVLPAFFV